MFYQLPPVGSPIVLDSSKALADVAAFSSYQTQFYASGTAALAAALLAVAAKSPKSLKPGQAEILLPAYGCPDLISAAVFAGVKPVLVDLEADRPWLDLPSLASAITDNTIAIVAVNLFGISERWSQLRALADQHQLVLIEDSAQYFPGGDEPIDWQGDLVVLSFGRGKPVSLLGGGAVLTKNEALFEHLPDLSAVPANLQQRVLFSLKSSLYNVMIAPRLYWILIALPFLHLGETRYHPLHSIDVMEGMRTRMLAGNINRYQNDAGAVVRHERISSMLDTLNTINNLPKTCGSQVNHRLLRYPLLVEAEFRDTARRRLNRAGFGVSVLYPTDLTRIAGLEFLAVDGQRFPNAEAFSDRLLTLPTYADFSEKDIKEIKAILKGMKH
jgi:dTDP-4-amino-4,6-dideoxygalactose transaminase